jgi:hypothetical protein
MARGWAGARGYGLPDHPGHLGIAQREKAVDLRNRIADVRLRASGPRPAEVEEVEG